MLAIVLYAPSAAGPALPGLSGAAVLAAGLALLLLIALRR